MLRVVSPRSLFIASLLAGCGGDTVDPTSTTTTFTSDPATTADSSGGSSTQPTGEPTTAGPATTDATSTGTSTSTTSTGDTTDTTGPVDPSATTPGTSSTGATTTDATTTDATTDATEGCNDGNVGCPCDGEMGCVPEGTCFNGVCQPNGGNLCPYEFDGKCDEPTVVCPAGSDPYDCCASQGDGVCEEVGMGGTCPVGTDSFDCGGCEYTNDGVCDEPNLCPPGSDKPDCCATENDGVCEQVNHGGICPNGTDPFDCGECEYANDGFCDEPFLCDVGTDGDDCCATTDDGVCEEFNQGGMCPDGSDYADCGECQFAFDGECDEPNLCDPGTDGTDC